MYGYIVPIALINNNLERKSKSATENCPILNRSKAQSIIFSKKPLDAPPLLNVDGQCSSRVVSLGLILTSEFNWIEYVASIAGIWKSISEIAWSMGSTKN